MAVASDDLLGAPSSILDTEWSDSSSRRSPLWVEALAMIWLLWLYDAINNLSPLRLHAALSHAWSLVHVERVLHLDPELSLNTWAVAHRAVALPMADFYNGAHFIVTLGLVAWLWWRHPALYRPLRNCLVLINVIGFLVFWFYPLAPPRMLPSAGFVDVVAVTHAWGSWHSSALASQANELAAMPSLHVAWACWSSLALWQILRGHRLRIAAIAYPIMTAFVVMATANHFLLDVLAGLLTVVAAAGGLTVLWRGWADWPPGPLLRWWRLRGLATDAGDEPARR
jgi:hypothetical protein